MDEIIKQNQNHNQLLTNIREILLSARHTAYKAVNFAMVTAYWNIGKLMSDNPQNILSPDKGVWKGIWC